MSSAISSDKKINDKFISKAMEKPSLHDLTSKSDQRDKKKSEPILNILFKANEESRASEKHYRSLFNDSPISLWEEDFSVVKKFIDGQRAKGINDFRRYFTQNPRAVAKCAALVKVEDVNKATLKLYKAKSKKQFQSGLGIVFSKESFDVFKEELIAIAEGKSRFESEAINKTLTGENINVNLTWLVAPGYESVFSKVFVSIIDITKDKAVDSKLRESEERYRTLIETSPDAIALTDANRNVTWVNKQAALLFGFKTREEMLSCGRNAFDFIAPQSRRIAKEAISSSLRTDGVRNLEVTLKKEDGTLFPAELSSSIILDHDGKPKGFVGVVRDIADRKKAEKELIKLSSVVKQTDDNVFITDKDGVIEYVNPSFERLTGFKTIEVIGKRPNILKSGLHDNKFYDNLWKTILAGKVFREVLINQKKDGQLYYEEKTITPIKDAQGNITHFVSTGNDITARKKAEEALKASEEKYSTLVEKGNDGIIIIQDGLLKFANKKVAEITGFSVRSAIDRPFTDFVAPEHRKLVLEKYKKRLRGKEVAQTYEIEIFSRNGQKIPVEINASVIEHEGKPADMAIIRDISERKETERELAEEKKKMESIFNTTKDGLALYDSGANVVSINPSLSKLFGVKKDIVGVNRAEIANNRNKYFKHKMERSDDSIRTHEKVLAGKTVSNVLIKIYSKPIKYLEGTYVPIKGGSGKVVGMIASFRDVTILKLQADRISQQLIEVERQRNRWEAVFGGVEEGVLITDKRLRIISANSSCELMSGCSEKEMFGKPFYNIFGCHNRLGHYFPDFNPVSKLLKTEEAIPYDEHLHTGKDGRERWVGVSYTPIFNEAGQIEQIVSVIRDITALKELEKAKSEFVSVASHELRTPLTVINGYLSLLLSGDLAKLSEQDSKVNFQSVIGKIYNETQRLTKLVEELLNISRIEDGRVRLSLRKVSVPEVINEVVKEFDVLAQSKGIKLGVDYDLGRNGENCCVLADKDKFKQILVNLIDNAIKYTNSGGVVAIECFQRNGLLHTQVKDTGAGIAVNVLPRIFEKFQQGGGSIYLKENKGTGLGLFVVKSLVELHKGKIWVDSSLGRGTKFTFTLPLVAAS